MATRRVAWILMAALWFSGCLSAAPPNEAGAAADVSPELVEESRVVIALVDTGINPYHQEFRDEKYVDHPSTYVTGFPDEAVELPLTLDAASYEEAVAADRAVWESVEVGVLYYVPGTRIIGAYATADYGGTNPTYPVLDTAGHGTATASMAAGRTLGTAPEALIVAIESDFAPGTAYASTLEWIDVMSNSWQLLANAPVLWGIPDDTKRAYDRGTSVYFAAGNGAALGAAPVRDLSLWGNTGGPSWVVTVGSHNPAADKPFGYHSIPVDVNADGGHCEAASATSLNQTVEFGGTSCATPIAAGVHAGMLLAARRILGDVENGPREGRIVAQGHATLVGPLSDGRLSIDEAEGTVMATAIPSSAGPDDLEDFPYSHWSTPASYAFEGYGVVNLTSLAAAVAVVLGNEIAPDRSDVDAYFALVDAARDAYFTAHVAAREATPPI